MRSALSKRDRELNNLVVDATLFKLICEVQKKHFGLPNRR
jgi:hypothetical protein